MLKKILAVVVVVVVVLTTATAFSLWRYPLALAARYERRQLTRKGFVREKLAAQTGALICWEAGQGPVIVMIHGAGDQAGTWSQVAPQLATRYRVLLPDLPGHGESEPRSGPISLGAELQGLEAVVDHSGARKVTLIGNSMGAWVALLYARAHPDRVEQVVAINGGALRANLAVNLMPSTREEARGVMQSIQDPGSPAIPGFVLDDIVRTSHAGPIARLVETRPEMERYVLDGQMRTLRTPVEIVWGEADRMLGMAYATQLQAELPTAHLRTLPRCGHIPQRECPRALTSNLLDVMAR